jgi:hypothetical protein
MAVAQAAAPPSEKIKYFPPFYRTLYRDILSCAYCCFYEFQ